MIRQCHLPRKRFRSMTSHGLIWLTVLGIGGVSVLTGFSGLGLSPHDSPRNTGRLQRNGIYFLHCALCCLFFFPLENISLPLSHSSNGLTLSLDWNAAVHVGGPGVGDQLAKGLTSTHPQRLCFAHGPQAAVDVTSQALSLKSGGRGEGRL